MTENIYTPPDADLKVPHATELASRWVRLGGTIIDTVLAVIFTGLLIYFTNIDIEWLVNIDEIIGAYLNIILGLIIFLILHGYLLSKAGQTIGKRILGIRIVSDETNEILPLKHLILWRYLPISVLSLIPLAGGIFILVNFLFIFRSDNRCVHDHIAGTKVVKVNAH